MPLTFDLSRGRGRPTLIIMWSKVLVLVANAVIVTPNSPSGTRKTRGWVGGVGALGAILFP